MKNWKTTLLGAIIAIGIAIKPLVMTGQIDWSAVALAAGVALLGYFMKDKNVTGGTVAQ